MTTRSLSGALGAALGTISTTLESSTLFVETIASAIEVAHIHSDVWRKTTQIEATHTLKNAEKIGLSRAALKLARSRQEVLSLCKDSSFAELYAQAMKELSLPEKEVSEE